MKGWGKYKQWKSVENRIREGKREMWNIKEEREEKERNQQLWEEIK